MKPRWTVLYNIISEENPTFVGKGWEFFSDQVDAIACCDRHVKAGRHVCLRPYVDRDYDKCGDRDSTHQVNARTCFEVGVHTLKPDPTLILRDSKTGRYRNTSIQCMWMGWKLLEGMHDDLDTSDLKEEAT